MPQKEQEQLNLLIDKRQAETLTQTELTELIKLTDIVEEVQAKRLSALLELATIRGVSLESLNSSLNLSPNL